MSWANPTALWLLAAILLLVFARRRKPQQRLAVANLYLWSAATTRDAPSLTRRFRRSLLLLLQAAFMAALIVAIARPLLSFGGGRVALIVDVSMSMGARDQSSTRLDAAKARAVELAEALPRTSRVRLWVAGATVDDRGEFGSRDAALKSAIQSLQMTDAGTDVESAVAQVRLADSPPSRIYVVTDGPGAAADDVEWSRIGGASENVALTRLTAKHRPADRSIEVLVAAANYGARAASFDAVISQNDSILARRAMQLPPRGEGSVVMTLPNTAGVVLARLESGDALTADDTRIVAIPPADPVRVRLINGSYFVERALTAHSGTLVVQSTPNGGAASADYDVIVCDGCADLPASAGSAGVLLLPPRPAAPREAAPVTVNINARAHPVVELLSLDSVLVSPVQSVPSQSPDGSRSGPASTDDDRVIAHAAGAAVIVAHEDGLRRIVELRFESGRRLCIGRGLPDAHRQLPRLACGAAAKCCHGDGGRCSPAEEPGHHRT